MEELDNFFGKEAVDAFVDGMNFDLAGEEVLYKNPAVLNTEDRET